MLRVIESSVGRERLIAAERFVESQAAGTDVLVLGGRRDAVDDFVRAIALHRGATFGLHRFSWAQFVTQLAISEISSAGLAPVSRLGSEAISARAAFEAAEQGQLKEFESVAKFPGFARSLSRTLTELRGAGVGPDALELAGCQDLAKLCRSHDRQLEDAGLVDWSETVNLARRAWAGAGTAEWKGISCLLLDAEIRTSKERQLLRSVIEESVQVLATLPVGDVCTRRVFVELGARPVVPSSDLAKTDLWRARKFLFAKSASPLAAPDGTVELFSAPGEARETVEIVRQIVELSRTGVAFDQMAVFLRSPELYAGHLETAFRRARIPAYFARGIRRPDAAGRAFLSLLSCRVEGLSAKRFAEYLAFAQVPNLAKDGGLPKRHGPWVGPRDDSLGPAVSAAEDVARSFGLPEQIELDFFTKVDPAQGGEEPGRNGEAKQALELEEDDPQLEGTLRAPWRWEDYLVEAAVIGGKDRWERRLKGLENELKLKLKETESLEPGSAQGLALRRETRHLRHLERFALPVIEALDQLPESASWSDWLGIFEVLVPQVIRKPQRVLAVLAEMRPMGSIGPVSLPEAIVVLTERLSKLDRDPPLDRFGRVYVAAPDDARGRSFRVVFCPGLAERIFPKRPREDPLLLDIHREKLSEELPVQSDRALDERMQLRLILGAASDKLRASWPRLEARGGRPRVPSFYALDIIRAATGTLPTLEKLERDNSRGHLAWPSPAQPKLAIDAVEHDLAVLGPLLAARPEQVLGRGRYLLETNEHLARSLRSRYARWRLKKWTPMDGMVRVTDQTRSILEEHDPKTRAYSVTALQKFAACPYQFFLSAIHRLEPRDEPAALIQLDPLTRGSIIHRIQTDLLYKLRDLDWLPLLEERVEEATVHLDEAVKRVSTEYAEDLFPAIERIWDDGINSIRADLRVWLRKIPAESKDWVPEHFEWTFGMKKDYEGNLSPRPDPVVVLDGWKLRGAVDLIEVSTAGDSHRVTDHKTGKDFTQEGWIVGGGETLQPVLYSLVVEQALGLPVPQARLAFSTSRGGFQDRRFDIHEFARLYAKQAMQSIDQSIRAGALPPAPKEGKCEYCDFRKVCGSMEESRWLMKDDSILGPLQHLRELP